ncbi:MAG: cytochrome C [Gammaproteobacteria bacterium]|nr:cytochrome C [Gammaproteobacteria bacterium]
MNKQVLMVFSLLLGTAGASLFAAYPDAQRGQLLYENHCNSCHEDHVHMRQGSSTLTSEQVAAEVARWAETLKLRWEKQDIADVHDYLLGAYYQKQD